MQAVGDEFWKCLEDYHNGLCLEKHIKNVLNVRGYSSLNALKEFGENDIKDVTDFMRVTFHLILKKKYSDDGAKLESEMEKYYGPIWCHLPDKFEIGGGYLKTLKAISDKIHNVQSDSTKSQGKRQFQLPPKKQQLSVPKLQDKTTVAPQDEAAITQRGKLKTLVDKWLKKQTLPEVSNDPLDKCEVNDISVSPNGFGSYVATIGCPFPKCEVKLI